MNAILCDRCKAQITQGDDWFNGAGNCTCCGDDLCKDCAVSFDDDGYCKSCHDDAAHGKRQKEEEANVGIDITMARAQAHYNVLSMAVSETLENLQDLRNEPFRNAYGILTAIIDNLENKIGEEKELLW